MNKYKRSNTYDDSNMEFARTIIQMALENDDVDFPCVVNKLSELLI